MGWNEQQAAFQMEPEDEREDSFFAAAIDRLQKLSFLKIFYDKFLAMIAISFFFMVIEQGLLTFLPYLQGGIIDNLATHAPIKHSVVLGVSILLAFLGSILFSYIREIYVLNHIYYDLPKFANTVLLRKLFRLSIGQYSNTNSGLNMSIVTKGNNAVHQFLEVMVYHFIPFILQYIIITSAIFWVSRIVGCIVLVISTLFLALQYYTGCGFYGNIKNNQNEWNTQSKFFYEILRNLKLAKLSVKDDDIVNEFEASYDRVAFSSRTLWRSYFKGYYSHSVLVRSGQVLALLVGVYLVSIGAKSPGTVVMLIGWMGTVFGNLGDLGSIQRAMMQHLSDIHIYHNLLEMEPAVKEVPFPVSLPALAGKIEFRRVSFNYPGEQPGTGQERQNPAKAPFEPANAILSDISFVIEPGETVAIVGPSGAGKSTIINLLLRGYDPDSGTIRVDDVDLREVEQRSFLSKVGYVPQVVDLFDNTLAYNLAFFMTDPRPVTEAELDQVARKARIDQFYDRLGEKKFDVVIGENGVKLSGGERQRVGIARALLKDPNILIFDEATSNLDAENEAIIHDAMREALQGRTGIIIAHRLSTIKDAHKIIVMDRGRVASTGRHGMLMECCDVYRRLVERQIVLQERSA